MKSLWSDSESATFRTDLELRVYTSQLLGRDKSLVLHGGGNTSVKVSEPDLYGAPEDILYVKGSGWDLETIAAAGFAPVRLQPVKRLATLPALSDPEMVNALMTCMTRASAPAPSVETILHALLPYRYVDHTHADAVLSITNTADGEARIRDIYGDSVVVIPYVMPGFDLARVCAERFAKDAGPQSTGMVLMNHGIFSFGDTARESYERMIALVDCAEQYLARNHAWVVGKPMISFPAFDRLAAATLRQAASRTAGFPMVMQTSRSDTALAWCARPDIADVSQRGPATPDHVIRTKQLPAVGRDIAAYADTYRNYFGLHSQKKQNLTMLDPAPRIVIDASLGLCTFGRSARDARTVMDLYDHTMDVIDRAERLGGYRALPAQDIFDVEYWDLEQAKLRKQGRPPALAGEVAVITGAASGIGAACVTAMLARGAAVVALDRDVAVEKPQHRPDYLGIQCDITDGAAIDRALDMAVRAYGGVDMLLLNAGVFPASQKIAELSSDTWRQTMAVNVDANATLLQKTYQLLQLTSTSGRVVVIGSRNVPAPGIGAAAYSASKAALTQLARVAALEWADHGIRVNILHPDAVYDTGLWTPEVLASRAASYGISVDDYKRRTLLKAEVTSRDVAELAAEMCGPLFARTTGAQLPVDGGNDRVI